MNPKNNKNYGMYGLPLEIKYLYMGDINISRDWCWAPEYVVISITKNYCNFII